MSKQDFVSSILDNMNGSIRFCMPGHNGELDISSSLDITELDFSDNLQNPIGIIRQLEDKIASIYHVDATLLFTSGATSAIATALATAKQFGGKIAVDSRAHKSVYSYATLLGLEVISVDDLSPTTTDIGGILITTPDYFGKTYDAKRYRLAASEYKVPLIVDQSHGAHFVFSNLLPKGQDSIADITINSLHKTMPVLTGGAIANVTSALADLMRFNRALLHTTSPSYLIMSSIEHAIDDFSQNGERYYQSIRVAVDTFASGLDAKYLVEKTDDFTRLVIKVSMNANAVSRILQSHKIYIEMTDANRLVLILTPYNYKHLPTLMALLNDIAINENDKYTDFLTVNISDTCQKSIHTTMGATACGDIEFVPLVQACGRILANDVGIYPPGTPIARAGTVLTAQAVKMLENNQNNCFGLIGGNAPCLRRKI